MFASATARLPRRSDHVAARQAMTAIGQIAGMQHARIKMPDGRMLAEMGIAAQLDSDLRIDGTEQISVLADPNQPIRASDRADKGIGRASR